MSKLACILALVLLSMLSVRMSSVRAGDEPTVRLPGHVPASLALATRLPRHSDQAAMPLTLTLVLWRSDEAGFAAYIHAITDPASPVCGQILTSEDVADRFGPTQQDYADVQTFLTDRGFTLTQGSANRLTLTVTGSRGIAEGAFGVLIDDYQLAGRVFYANDIDPAVPESLALVIRTVAGLSNLAQPVAD